MSEVRRNVNMDYKSKYERLKKENDLNRQMITRFQRNQPEYEKSFKNFQRLHLELDQVHRDAEARNAKIQQFLASFLPEFQDAGAAQYERAANDPFQEFCKKNDAPLVIPLPLKTTPSKAPPLPKIEYKWADVHCSSPHRSSYNYVTRSNFGRLDELKLSFRFDVDSRTLPTKIQLEITDPSGRVVYKKRQNVYYVLVQERIPTLDGEKDYQMILTSITGTDEAQKKVIIHNKHHEAVATVVEDNDAKTSPDAATLETAIQEFVEEIKYFEAQPIKGQAFEASVKPLVVETPKACEVKRVSCIVLKRPFSPNVTPLIVQKKMAIPKVQYRWQRGFRKAHNGRYLKVPLLKVQVKYPEDFEQLPKTLQLSIGDQTKLIKLPLNELNCEFQLSDTMDYVLNVEPDDPDDWPHVPRVGMSVSRLGEDKLNEWQDCDAKACQ